jgi:hypothetical protein
MKKIGELFLPTPVGADLTKRAMDCVRACAGMEDPEAEIEKLRADNKVLRDAMECVLKIQRKTEGYNEIQTIWIEKKEVDE